MYVCMLCIFALFYDMVVVAVAIVVVVVVTMMVASHGYGSKHILTRRGVHTNYDSVI